MGRHSQPGDEVCKTVRSVGRLRSLATGFKSLRIETRFLVDAIRCYNNLRALLFGVLPRRAIWNFDTLTPNGDDIPNYPVGYLSVVPKGPVTLPRHSRAC